MEDIWSFYPDIIRYRWWRLDTASPADEGQLSETELPLTEKSRDRNWQRSAGLWVRMRWAGGFISTWQDEWERTGWNTALLPLCRQSITCGMIFRQKGQNFGLMAFEPGAEAICILDGDPSEWEAEDVLHGTGWPKAVSPVWRRGGALPPSGEGTDQEDCVSTGCFSQKWGSKYLRGPSPFVPTGKRTCSSVWTAFPTAPACWSRALESDAGAVLI